MIAFNDEDRQPYEILGRDFTDREKETLARHEKWLSHICFVENCEEASIYFYGYLTDEWLDYPPSWFFRHMKTCKYCQSKVEELRLILEKMDD